jgi:hypothetical protein
MNIYDIFRSASAFRAVFKLGYIPKRSEFYELTPEQYKKYYETEKKIEEEEKIFMLLPSNVEKYNELASGDVYVFSGRDIDYIMEIETLIDKYCMDSETTFETIEDKLYYVANLVPPSFISGTKFEKKRVIYMDNKKKKNKKK